MPVLGSELEAAIVRDPDDLDAYAVYGDWLAEQGDPRGELIATQLAAAAGDAELKRAALRVFAKHREIFVGKLGSMITADAFTWRAGFIERAVLSHDRLLIEDGARVASSLAEVVQTLLAHPSGRFLRELVVRTNDRDGWNRWVGTQKEVVEQIAAARPGVLRRLQLGDAAYGIAQIGRVDALWPAQMRELVLEGDVALGQVVAPALRVLRLWPMPMRKKLARELIEATWPQLESLQLHLGQAHEHVMREIVTLIHRSDMPALVHLGLVAYSRAETILEELSRAPLLARLETLDLRHGRISDRGLRPLLTNAAAFRHLARIDLSETGISAKQFERARKLLPNVVGESP